MRHLYPSLKQNGVSFGLCLLFTICSAGLYAQGANPAPAGDYTFNTQAQVDAFQNGALYTSVDGSLTISASGTIDDLSNFAELVTISDELVIENYGTDEPIRNPLARFSDLEQTGGIWIYDINNGNPGITSVSSVSLTSVTGRIEIGDGPNLNSVNLPSLTTVLMSFIIRNNLTQDFLTAENLSTIGGNLNIKDVNDLVNLNGLSNVSSIGGSILIEDNDVLTEIDGLGQNDELNPASRFAYTVDEFRVVNNPTLGDLVPLRVTITDKFILTDNPAIGELGENIVLGDNLSEITVVNNGDLQGLNEVLDNTGTITVLDVNISNNATLDNLGGQGLNITGSLTYSGNPRLSRLPQVSPTTSLTGDLTITDMAILAQTTRLNNLTQVGGAVLLQNNPQITALGLFQRLAQAGSIVLNNNNSLLSLNGFDAASLNIDNFFTISNNDALGDCCAPTCKTTVNGAQFDGFNSAITIENNTGNCENKQAVVSACADEPGKGCLAAAPVEFIAFTGSLGNGYIDLDFATATESDNDYFQIERSVDGGSYTAIGRLAGAGNSLQEVTYSFRDFDYSAGVNYYRIRQVDFDGTEAFSDVIVVDAGGSSTAITLFPNPATGSEVTLQLGNDWNTERVTAQIFTVSGQLVTEIRAAGNTRLTLPTAGLQAGLYAVRVSDGGHTVTQRLTVR